MSPVRHIFHHNAAVSLSFSAPSASSFVLPLTIFASCFRQSEATGQIQALPIMTAQEVQCHKQLVRPHKGTIQFSAISSQKSKCQFFVGGFLSFTFNT